MLPPSVLFMVDSFAFLEISDLGNYISVYRYKRNQEIFQLKLFPTFCNTTIKKFDFSTLAFYIGKKSVFVTSIFDWMKTKKYE